MLKMVGESGGDKEDTGPEAELRPRRGLLEPWDQQLGHKWATVSTSPVTQPESQRRQPDTSDTVFSKYTSRKLPGALQGTLQGEGVWVSSAAGLELAVTQPGTQRVHYRNQTAADSNTLSSF